MYTYDQVFEKTLEYFEGDELATNVFFKYVLRDKEGNYLELTPDDMHRRLAKEFARIEKKYPNPMSEDYIYSFLAKFKYIVPQGSPMYGIGNNYSNVSLSNCVVVASPEDDISSIMNTGKNLANLYKRRCGVGLDLSNLRPDGSKVSNAAGTTSGAWSFADYYSYITRMIGQSGRRGALMLTMDIRHPDIEKFITMKQDLTKVTGANVSIKINDEFMKAVENDENYCQYWPLQEGYKSLHKHYQWAPARKVWDLIVNSATKTAEPGILMWDNITKNLPAHCYPDFKTIATNPCCFNKESDVFVVTEKGIKEIKKITSSDKVWVDTEQKWVPTSGYFSAGTASVYKVVFSDNSELEITENHKLNFTKAKRNGSKIEYVDGGLIELKELKVGDKILSHINETNCSLGNKGTYQEGCILGWLAGDGCLNYSSERSQYPSCILDFWKTEHDTAYAMQDILNSMGYDLALQECKENDKLRLKSERITDDLVNKYQFNIWQFRSKDLPAPFLFEASRDFVVGFLKYYFAADGTVTCNHENKSYNIQLASINKQRLIQIQQLLYIFGIKSSIGLGRKGGEKDFGSNRGGAYQTRDLWRISITGKNNIANFNKHIGFACEHKQKILNDIFSTELTKQAKGSNYTTIKSIEHIGEREVGCIEVPDFHRFTANGIISGNSELPLSAFDTCRLISINLKHLVENAFAMKPYFNFEKFKEVVVAAQRLSDDLVDLELEKIDNILSIVDTPDEIELWNKMRKTCADGRRTGLGTHGLADALARLGLRYDSDKAIEVVDKIYATLKESAYQESVDMAANRGSFPVFDWDTEKDNLFIRSLPDHIQHNIREYGRRNISILTNAPTGSVSILSQCSSGIEPVFQLSYKRRRKRNHDEKHQDTDFIDKMGDRWEEFEVFHHNFKEWKDKAYHTEEQPFPDYFVTSSEIDWEKRVDVQSVIQKHIDHAISSTINLPRGTSPEVVGKLYQRGWEKGLKGITVYVDGSRDGVLITNDETKKEKDFQYIDAPKRGEELECDIHNVSVKGERWIILVGLKDGKPYEVFGGLSENIEIPSKYKKGTIIKIGESKTKPSKYNLKVNDMVIKDVLKMFDNVSYQVHTRMVSLALRHGAKPSFLVEQLQKDPDNDLTSFSKVLARVLKKYIEDGTKVSGKSSCPECGDALIYNDGCVLCVSCGFSKCG